MRSTTLLRIILALKQTFVMGLDFRHDELVVDVRPSKTQPRCSCCHRKAPNVYDRRTRLWRHLDLGGMMTYLRYSLRRVRCRRCGIKVEEVPWAETASRFTRPFENQVAYLAQRCDHTTVTEIMRIAWRTVGEIVSRVVEDAGLRDPQRLDGLRHIGIDELSYRKHHKYVTIVTDHVAGAVIWAGEGRSSDVVAAFFQALGSERTAAIATVTLDMSAAFIKGVEENAPNAELIFDRFHVQRLVHDALDEVRREIVRNAESKEERKAIKGTRWSLQKNPWNLIAQEKDQLSEIRRCNAPLYRGYELKESLLGILDGEYTSLTGFRLSEWLDWACRSRLKPFENAAKTIRKYKDGILAYIRTRFSNGRVEGLNSKARTLTRRAYGFHSASSLISMLFLCCSGLRLEPSHAVPFMDH